MRAKSCEEGESSVSLNVQASGLWTGYLVGAVKIMNRRSAGIKSLTIGLASGVPLGAGVSSSAALEIYVLRALRDACSLTISNTDLAYAAQQIENEHPGLKTGIMDQMASSVGESGVPLLSDTHSGACKTLPAPSNAIFLPSTLGYRDAWRRGATIGGVVQQI